MAFATATLGVVPGSGTVATTFAVAVCGLAIGLLVYGRLNAVVVRQSAHAVRPLLFPLGPAVATTMIATSVCSLRVTQVVPVIAPLLIVLLSVRTDARNMLLAGPARAAIEALPSCETSLKDLTVFAVGFALARASRQNQCTNPEKNVFLPSIVSEAGRTVVRSAFVEVPLCS